MSIISNSGRFSKGWTGTKVCVKCNKNFQANSGVHKICQECKKCLHCGNYLIGKPYNRKLCNLSCASKWRYMNLSEVRRNLADGIKHPNRGKGISRYRTGLPRPDHAGEKNANWRGGTSGERQKVMASIPYKQWRKAVFDRDDYTCQICFKRGGTLQADHIKPYALFPKLRLDIKNGRTLCKSCHMKTDTWGQNVYKYSA